MSELAAIKQRLDQLETENEQLRNCVDKLEAEKAELENRVDDLEAEKAQLQERVDDLEEQPTIDYEDHYPAGTLSVDGHDIGTKITTGVSSTAHQKDLKKLKAKIEAQTQGADQGETTVHQHETHLEEVCAWDDDFAEIQLTPNQLRARYVALNLADFATKTPKGRILRAGDLRRVLKARFDNGHSETVNRVREFLDSFGDDLVEVKDPRTAGFSPDTKGEKASKGKQIVVDEQLAYSLHQINQQQDHDVVTGAEA